MRMIDPTGHEVHWNPGDPPEPDLPTEAGYYWATDRTSKRRIVRVEDWLGGGLVVMRVGDIDVYDLEDFSDYSGPVSENSGSE